MEYLFIYTTSFGAAVSIGKRKHIKIDFFLLKLKQPYRAIVDSIGLLFIMAINIIILILSVNWIEKTGKALSPVMRIPKWTIQISVPIGCGLAALYSLLCIRKTIRQGINEKNEESV